MLIELFDVHKRYTMGATEVHAVRGVNLQIDREEFVAIVGPSGSGKSTLLNLIGTIDEPTSGRIDIDGRALMGLSDDQRTELRNRTIGFVFQRFSLVPVLSALENVALALQLQGVPWKQAEGRARAMLGEVGLADFVQHRPDHLSGGQQQRVAIARALVTKPSLVIADEPTANLDSVTAQSIIDLLRKMNREHRTTFVFSTHDDRLLGHVDRHIVLKDGRIQEGDPRRVSLISAHSAS